VLTANLEVEACPSITIQNSVDIRGILKRQGSVLRLEPATNNTQCGIDLVGLLDIEACQTFSITSDQKLITGDGVSGTLTFDTDPNDPCKLSLNGNVNIKACTELAQLGSFKFRGSAFRPKDDTEQYSPEKVYQELTITHAKTEAGEDNLCSIMLGGDIHLDACTNFDIDDSEFSISGTAVKLTDRNGEMMSKIKFVPTSTPDCKLSILGDLVIDACTSITISDGAPTLSGFSEGSSLQLSLAADSGGCGIQLTGNLDVPSACESVELLTFGAPPMQMGYMRFTDQDDVDISDYHYFAPVIAPSGDLPPCSVKFTPDLGKYTMKLTLPKVAASSKKVSHVSSCEYNPSEHALGISVEPLGEDPGKQEISLTGAIPKPCFQCGDDISDDAPATFNEISLKHLYIRRVLTADCCNTPDNTSTLDMCDKQLYLADSPTNSVNITVPPAGMATWRQLSICVDGVFKTSWVLMTEPV
jgi:hypothetical protein